MPKSMTDLYKSMNNSGRAVTMNIVSAHVQNDEFRMSWDLTISDAPQDILHFITAYAKIIHGLGPELQQSGTPPEIGDQ